MATHHQYWRRQRTLRIYRLHQILARRICGRQLRHIRLPPTQSRVSKHLPPPANQRIPLPFILALLNHLVQLRQLRRPERRHRTLPLGNVLFAAIRMPLVTASVSASAPLADLSFFGI
ncbi:hypothetical protein TRVL_05516 [Trypanosoma vivax]|nr:hypothetical protein TRVL_05516 [Trypanosoma vivax]